MPSPFQNSPVVAMHTNSGGRDGIVIFAQFVDNNVEMINLLGLWLFFGHGREFLVVDACVCQALRTIDRCLVTDVDNLGHASQKDCASRVSAEHKHQFGEFVGHASNVTIMTVSKVSHALAFVLGSSPVLRFCRIMLRCIVIGPMYGGICIGSRPADTERLK